MNLVIVESPAKAKTINKYLGKDFQVVASFGHIRDLPSKNGSVLPDENFKMIYELNEKSLKHIKEIISLAKESDEIYLATDPDREGEAISWHIIEVLKEKKALKKGVIIKRIAFNEITKKAVIDAVNNPRNIDENLVNAQQARRALDYLVGFTLSPILWRKLPGSKSAGRVQSVALRLICDRENEIEVFKNEEYWTINLDFLNQKDEFFSARLTEIEGVKLEKFSIPTEDQARLVESKLKDKKYFIENIEKKQQRRSPPAPFITSSLQQDASRRLGFTTKKTMMVAQKLYEGIDINKEVIGLITYMRTDGVSLSEGSVIDIRGFIEKEYGGNYLPKESRIYKSKVKNAQEAHEAIRPTDVNITPKSLKGKIEEDYFKLYELIWKRTVACQMEVAVFDLVAAEISSEDRNYKARATGSTLKFDGFYKLYRESVEQEDQETDNILPILEICEKLKLEEVKPDQHFTEPPPRYSEASLVKKLEELGIGRPSTYSSIISVLQERQYVKIDKKRFMPEERGMIVTAFLKNFFNQYVEYDFTARLEDKLDDIASGNLDWQSLLADFWKQFYMKIDEAGKLNITEVINTLNEVLAHHLFKEKEDGTNPRACPKCSQGELSLKLGKYGAFVACSNYPECNYTHKIGEAETPEETPMNPSAIAGIEIKKGPYGFYLEAGLDENNKPKRYSIPYFIKPEELDVKLTEALTSLPKNLGTHPDTGEEIIFGIGKFGPYVKYLGKFIGLTKSKEILFIDIPEAVKFIEANASKPKKAEGTTSKLPIKKTVKAKKTTTTSKTKKPPKE